MLSCEIIGFLGSDAKKPKKVVLLTYLINIEKKEQIKPYGYLVSLIMKQRSWIF